MRQLDTTFGMRGTVDLQLLSASAGCSGVAPCKLQINLKPKGQCLQASWRRDTTQGPWLSQCLQVGQRGTSKLWKKLRPEVKVGGLLGNATPSTHCNNMPTVSVHKLPGNVTALTLWSPKASRASTG